MPVSQAKLALFRRNEAWGFDGSAYETSLSGSPTDFLVERVISDCGFPDEIFVEEAEFLRLQVSWIQRSYGSAPRSQAQNRKIIRDLRKSLPSGDWLCRLTDEPPLGSILSLTLTHVP